MPAARRAVLAALIASGSVTMAVAASPRAEGLGRPRFPVQSIGNRGTNVEVIQYLLRGRGYHVAVDGMFGLRTRDAVVSFQRSRGVRDDGVVGYRTWARLVRTLGIGDRGPEVRALQLLLVKKSGAGLDVDGDFGRRTSRAVVRMQHKMGLPGDGVVDRPDWRHLIWHFELPDFGPSSLCDYDTINRDANWGTAAAVAQLQAAAERLHRRAGMAVAVGDLGHRYGGEIAGHVTHEAGLDVDIRPIRDDGRQCSTRGTFWWHVGYDRDATRQLVRAIRATARGHVKEILFNDPSLVAQGLTVRSAGHDDHLHVRYCESRHRDWRYRC